MDGQLIEGYQPPRAHARTFIIYENLVTVLRLIEVAL